MSYIRYAESCVQIPKDERDDLLEIKKMAEFGYEQLLSLSSKVDNLPITANVETIRNQLDFLIAEWEGVL